jgi:hypothetical protein
MVHLRKISGVPQNIGHKSTELSIAVFESMKILVIDIQAFRGQSYDNAANMAEVYSGLQTRVKEVHLYALHVPYTVHSLNLISRSAEETCHEAISLSTFF